MSEPILLDAASGQLVKAVEDNCIALFHQMASVLGGEVEHLGGFGRHTSFPHHPTFKGAWQSRLSPDMADVAIDDTIAWFKRRNVPSFYWWTDASTLPDDLGHRLMLRGFVCRETPGGILRYDIPSTAQGSPVMVADMRQLDESILTRVPDGFRVSEVSSESDLGAFAQVVEAVYPQQPEAARGWADATRHAGIGSVPWKLYIGWLGDEAVATNIVVEGGGIVSLWVIATMPHVRRKGIGSAITLAPLFDWRTKGYQYAGLFASAEGAPVYERIGFERTGTCINRYLWRAQG